MPMTSPAPQWGGALFQELFASRQEFSGAVAGANGDGAPGHETAAHYAHKARLLRQIEDIATECVEYGWDGEDAEPVSEQVIMSARRLVARLPIALPMPELCPDADGEIGAEWHVSPSVWGIITVGADRIYYAMRYGADYRSTGAAPLNDRDLDRVLSGLSILQQ